MNTMNTAMVLDLETAKKAEQSKIFAIVLIASFAIHAAVLMYQGRRQQFVSVAPRAAGPISLKISVAKPIPKKKVEPVKKVVKKKVAKKKAKPVAKPQPKPKEEVIEQAPQQLNTTTESFDSVIENYSQPIYPRMAIRRELTGIVVLTLWVKSNGLLEKVELTKSSGHGLLDKSALDAVKKWKFKDLSQQNGTTFKVQKRIVYKIN